MDQRGDWRLTDPLDDDHGRGDPFAAAVRALDLRPVRDFFACQGNISPRIAGAHGVIAKPFSRTGLISATHHIAESVMDPPPSSVQPESFIASSAFASAWATAQPR